ncbi:hypothetical protein BCR32DRAFT_243422 [Anaeromyces robustus]|uniref:G-protein coupled receptors family 3 profile domain-containing protein n=1 Tax=Anaeromyces robustus TaxID=1754192 RepID=A0A1Y1XC99_9FUNG|nr:hypothetical protein BCR32DRAFT_243422 [Anaeromyces robustus]|eukprot:ORX83358.1 hypothetical protein BCR32DRAFT_243422 [Anaeromyces robustus]
MKIDDLTKFYCLSLNTDNTSVGLILCFIIIGISVFILSSLIFLFINKFKPYFSFLDKDFWIILIIGVIMMMFSFFTKIGKPYWFYCHIQSIILSFSLTFYSVPILYKLIISFPKKDNKISKFINKSRKTKYLFFLLFILLDIILNSLMILTPYDIENKMFDNYKNFQICTMKKRFGRLVIYFIFIFKTLIILFIVFLIFLEWNYKPLHNDIRFLIIAIIIWLLTKKDDKKIIYNQELNKYLDIAINNNNNTLNSETSTEKNIGKFSSKSIWKSQFISSLLNYHYKTGLEHNETSKRSNDLSSFYLSNQTSSNI